VIERLKGHLLVVKPEQHRQLRGRVVSQMNRSVFAESVQIGSHQLGSGRAVL